jgi:hypothetical protein
MYPPKKDPPRSVGVARYIVEKTLGGPTRQQESYPVVHSLSVVSVVVNNPDRAQLVISNITQGNIIIGTVASQVASGQGILVPAQGGLFEVDIIDDYTLPSIEWFALGTATNDGFPIYVLEVISDIVLAPEGP